MSDEVGRARAVAGHLLSPMAVVVAGIVATATANPRGTPYLVAALLVGTSGVLAADVFVGRVHTVGDTGWLTRPVGRTVGALTVTVTALLTSLVVAIQAGISAGLLPVVVAVSGFAWLAGVGFRRLVTPPATLACLRDRIGHIDRPTWYVLAFAGTLFVAFAAYTTWLYSAYWMGGSDFGAYVHMFSTTIDGDGLLHHGKYRVSQPRGSYWGGHFSLTLLAFLPLYALIPSPVTLLVAKSALVAASIPLVWVLARDHVGDDTVAGLVTVSYALNPFLWSAWVFDFQEQALLPVLVFGAFLAYRRDRRWGFVVLVALAFLTNEFMIIIFAGALAGLAVATARAGKLRDRTPELATTAVLALLAFVLAAVVTTRFSVDAGIPYASFADPFKPHLGTRTGPFALLAVVATSPGILLEAFTIDLTRKLLFFVALFSPVVFLGLNDEVSVGAVVPYLAFAWFFAGRELYYMFAAHYPFYLLPFIYVGTIRVLGRLDIDASSRTLLKRVFVTVILVNLFAGFAVGTDHDAFPVRSDPGHDRIVETAIEDIPEEASLVTQNDLYPHVATRSHATYIGRPDMFREYQAAHGTVTPTYILLDEGLTARSKDWSVPVEEAFGDRLEEEYGLSRCEDGVAVYERGYRGEPRGITRERPGEC